MICIWCKANLPKLSREHIIPEALGCPDEFSRDDIACQNCNSKLGREVDPSLIKPFEILKFNLGILGKRKQQPKVSGWAAVAGYHKDGDRILAINAGKKAVKDGVRKLVPAHRTNGISDAWIKPEEGRLGFKQDFGGDPKFVRGLYKVGLNAVAYYLGAEVAAGADYDHIRTFVLGDKGAKPFKATMDAHENFSFASGISGPMMKEGYAYPAFEVVLLGIRFHLDMAPDQEALRDLQRHASVNGIPLLVF